MRTVVWHGNIGPLIMAFEKWIGKFDILYFLPESESKKHNFHVLEFIMQLTVKIKGREIIREP